MNKLKTSFKSSIIHMFRSIVFGKINFAFNRFGLIFYLVSQSYTISPSFWTWCCCLSNNDSTEQKINIPFHSNTRSTDSSAQVLLQPSTSSMLLSTRQRMSQPNINKQTRRPLNLDLEEYEKKRGDINIDLEMLNQEFEFLLEDDSSYYKKCNEFKYKYSIRQREIFIQHLPFLEIQLLTMINSMDIRQIQAQEYQKMFHEIEMLARQFDAEHKPIITMWLTTFLNDEIREKKLITDYAINYIKEEVFSLFQPNDFQISKLSDKTEIFISKLETDISNNDSVRKKEIKKYLKKQPPFEVTLRNIFSELFIHKSCPDL